MERPPCLPRTTSHACRKRHRPGSSRGKSNGIPAYQMRNSVDYPCAMIKIFLIIPNMVLKFIPFNMFCSPVFKNYQISANMFKHTHSSMQESLNNQPTSSFIHFILSHRIHGTWYIFPYKIYHKKSTIHEGKYTISKDPSWIHHGIFPRRLFALAKREKNVEETPSLEAASCRGAPG